MNILYEKKVDDFYHRNDANGRTPLTCRAHMHYHVELVYMKKGEMRAFIDSEEYGVGQGELLVVFPNQVHRFEDVGACPEYELFIINPVGALCDNGQPRARGCGNKGYREKSEGDCPDKNTVGHVKLSADEQGFFVARISALSLLRDS